MACLGLAHAGPALARSAADSLIRNSNYTLQLLKQLCLCYYSVNPNPWLSPVLQDQRMLGINSVLCSVDGCVSAPPGLG